jgi:hypothetical protein
MAPPDDRTIPDPPDWLLLTDASRPNGLLIGTSTVVDVILEALRPSLPQPVAEWPGDTPWRRSQGAGTLILRDVGALGPDDCRMLLAWMDEAGSGVQVISIAPDPVYPLVQRKLFPASLYYRLNQICVDCAPATAA